MGKEEEARILRLIGNLANIDDLDFGNSTLLYADNFAPLPAARNAGAILIANGQNHGSEDLAELVKLGPKALPFLLKALDDQTPTKAVTPGRVLVNPAAMWFANGLSGNPGNEAEQKILESAPKTGKRGLSSYTFKIGDVCFVIIGQIVGRHYQAVQYVPTACMEIHSPTHDADLARQVRAIWSSQEPAQHLLDSLLLDYASRAAFTGSTADGWWLTWWLQVRAARRLIFYFPQQTTNLIAGRLRRLDISKYYANRDVSNGVWASEFIKAVAWSKEPAIRAELFKIFDATPDPEILGAAGMAMNAANPNAFRKRVEQYISNLPESEEGASGDFGDGFKFLEALGLQMGTEARPAFEQYMQHPSLQRRRTMCRLLTIVCGYWSVDFLGPLLEDSRPAGGWGYPVDPGQNQAGLSIRICDEAAETIARNFPKLSFKMVGEHEELDRQIQTMRDQIARHDYLDEQTR